jgi:hypothetical protein
MKCIGQFLLLIDDNDDGQKEVTEKSRDTIQ